MYRISCRYEPSVKRLGGRAKGGQKHKIKRGAWRATRCRPVLWSDVFVTSPHVAGGELQIVAVSPARPGNFCDPYALVKEYLSERRK